jgi:ABC-type multidrug transport system fused ATPase/permease subunit
MSNLENLYSLERIQGYIEIDHEPQATESGKPPAAWPTSGDLVVENLSARYSQVSYLTPRKFTFSHSKIKDGPTVLHNISFHIKSGERVGVGKRNQFQNNDQSNEGI